MTVNAEGWIPKQGEKVRLKSNRAGAFGPNGMLQIGDIVTVVEVNGNKISYEERTGQVLFLTDVEPILCEEVEQLPKRCNCDILVLLNSGCKCGGN
jgi:hypothetical protein